MKTIPLTKGLVTVVDDCWYPLLSQWKWCATSNGHGLIYAARSKKINGKTKTILMHRLVAMAFPGEEIDHWDGNTLNNQRSNLRRASPTQNRCNRGRTALNSSGFKGVGRNGNGWMARLNVQGRFHWLGQFKTPEDAASAYDEAAKRLHGEFAHLNFPQGHDAP